jgi:hypothetical protein
LADSPAASTRKVSSTKSLTALARAAASFACCAWASDSTAAATIDDVAMQAQCQTRARARDELVQAVPRGGGPGAHRLGFEVALHVVGHRVDGGVAALRLAAQRLGQDRVDVAAQRVRARALVPRAGSPRRLACRIASSSAAMLARAGSCGRCPVSSS